MHNTPNSPGKGCQGELGVRLSSPCPWAPRPMWPCTGRSLPSKTDVLSAYPYLYQGILNLDKSGRGEAGVRKESKVAEGKVESLRM